MDRRSISLSGLADYYPRRCRWQALLTAWSSGGRFRLAMALMLGISLLGSLPAMAKTPGEVGSIAAEGFDHYTLALTWHPGFCATRHDPPRECREASLRRGSETGFVLHGLWPSLPHRLDQRGVERQRWRRQGCFIERERPAGGFCGHPTLGLNEGLDAQLDVVMPGRASCLGRYQYAKHAACLRLSAEDLFGASVALVEAVNASVFTDFVVTQRGGEVRRNDLISAFESAFGEGRGRALRLECGGGGNRLLTEVRIGIDAQRLTDFPAPESLVRLGLGNCPARVKIAAF
ncbi:ribonuclease T2 family protein [Halomonas almeriensis]|uniref:ribonuclease T2 family protein n=1 Tax=Halomonas almeriensis TaxID=308163 RepID=UPI0025B538EB|nr:ribonuclease I [Halomonas almeriensis]